MTENLFWVYFDINTPVINTELICRISCMTTLSDFTGPHQGTSREINLPSLINSNDLLLEASQTLPLCWCGDEYKIAKPAERSCAWGGPVITVNWFNMGMDGGKDEKEK